MIKNLALSKLTHASLVLPSLSNVQKNCLDKIFFDFLWSEKNPKVAKADTFKPLTSGGLAMVNTTLFWKALKCSWAKRLTETKSFWPLILENNLIKNSYTLNEIFFSGPTRLSTIAKDISNPFWKDVLNSLSCLVQESHFKFPELSRR